MTDTVRSMESLKVTTSDGGKSIVKAARDLIAAGARENKKKKSILSAEDVPLYLESNSDELMIN